MGLYNKEKQIIERIRDELHELSKPGKDNIVVMCVKTELYGAIGHVNNALEYLKNH